MATLPKGQGVFLPPFKAWLASNIPAVYDNTMTYYEELVALIKYLQDIVVPAVNDNASAVTTISNAVEQLQSYVENYFANLDVQEEINNKLDQMAEDGTLQEIIATYLDANVTWTYLNVAEMKAATNLTNGSRARTLGYYAPNDGGDGLYYITNEENLVEDNGSIIKLTNGCFAKLVTENNNVNVKQFGAKGDGTTDDSEAVRNALKFNGNVQSSVSFVKGETYLVDGNFYIYSNTIVDLNKCEIKVVDGTPSSDAYNRVQFMNNLESMTVEGYGAIENFHVKNGTLNGNIGGISFLLFHGLNCSFTDIDFQNCFVSTHIFDLLGCKNIEIKSCKFVGNLLSLSSNNFREVIQPDYATYGAGPYWGNDPTFAFDSIPTDGLLVDSCIFKKNTSDLYYLNGVGTHATNTGVHTNIVVRNCEFYDCQYSNIRLPKSSNVTIEGNTFYNIRSDRNTDNFAINITNEGDLGVTALHDITIRNNKFISTGETTDQIFIRVAGRTNNATENVIIEGNTYSGKAVSNAAYTGNDFMQANDINGLRITNNSITRAKAILFKGTTPIENLVFNNNICDNCLRGVRSAGNNFSDNTDNIYPTFFTTANNVWKNPLGSFNTSSNRVVLGLDSDFTVSSTQIIRVPLVVKEGLPLYIDQSNIVRIPDYFRHVRITGFLKTKTTGDGTLQWTNLEMWDRPNIKHTYVTYDHRLQATTSETVSLGEITRMEDNFISYYNSDNSLLWKDGHLIFHVQVSVTGNATIQADGSNVIVEMF